MGTIDEWLRNRLTVIELGVPINIDQFRGSGLGMNQLEAFLGILLPRKNEMIWILKTSPSINFENFP